MTDSSASKFELETLYQIWDNRHGDYIEVGPDRDGLGLIELRVFTLESPGAMDHVISDRLTINDDQLPLLIKALQHMEQS